MFIISQCNYLINPYKLKQQKEVDFLLAHFFRVHSHSEKIDSVKSTKLKVHIIRGFH